MCTLNFIIMSKVTISAILAVVRLVLNLISKAVRMIYTVIDLCDDGCINNSVTRPAWVESLFAVISTLEGIGSELTSVETQITNGE